MKPVHYASSEFDAHLVRGYLETNNISAEIVENLRARQSGYSTEFVVAVPESDVEVANRLLADRNRNL